MYETTQKNITMTYQEFKTWEIPKGWRVVHMNGSMENYAMSLTVGIPNEPYFQIRIVLEKEK